jgi:hypothetical protein
LVTVRLRDWAPTPHDLVQVVQAVKVEVAQWTGHGVPQVRASLLCGQATPPKIGCTTSRWRFWVPTPQVMVHVDQACQLLTTQSTAHGCELQARVSAECGQALPPKRGSTVARLRFCEPVPHDLVQVDQAALEKAEYAQSTGHACVLHERVSA